MSFLLGDDYASSESESDEERTETSRVIDQEVEKEVSVQLLPSADSVLSSVSASTASFLPPKSSVKTQSSVKSFDLLEEQRQNQEKEEGEQKEVESTVDSHRNDRKRPAPPLTAQETKREKRDAKERVKNQRVKGQAGIGSDFRSWKSETEMALRQQFD
ncbi:hypothetical protein PHPALM_31575 [Phytophthora palmivora]|uniref:Uncharacterized protein n=1 Tax=Phytophthora palmivora TaxID=4796 RepID=A0A2P4X287_9STRA|nr:hypothetical protein PHPALM_31575 [Phytophthora palmivora]